MALIVSNEKSAVIHMIIFLYVVFFFFDSFQDFMVTCQNMIVIYPYNFHCIYLTWGIMKFLYLYVSVFQQIWDVWGIFLQDFFSYP